MTELVELQHRTIDKCVNEPTKGLTRKFDMPSNSFLIIICNSLPTI